MDFWLDGLRPGMEAEVTRVCCPKALKKRLADFGLVAGTKVACCYRSPDGGVVALRLRGTTIALRRSDFHLIAARRLP